MLATRFFLFAMIILSGSAISQTPRDDYAEIPCITKANRLLDESLGLMQKYYYRKDSVSWDSLIVAAKTRLKSSPDCEDAFATVKWCFQELKEKHSFIIPPVKAELYGGNINSNSAPLEKLIGPLTSDLLDGKIGYINVPWVSTADEKICTAFADSLQGIIASFDKKGTNKWIIDLRKNSGGNCWPMLAGLAPLLGNGVYGYFVSTEEKIPFSYKDGTMYQGKNARCVVTLPYFMKNKEKTIVILMGPGTSSAGEIAALAFKGTEKVYFFGEPTAGLTTANATYKLSDGSMLVLTVCKEADKNGRIVEGRIQPDELIISSRNNGKDAVLTSALMFLQMQE